jgi:cellulose synthase/poly-beta-1,6-N-acetylglucosamine synthase-like glycosyltransferase
LGGNTVFIWRHLLEEVGGWDTSCLAEDAEIGVRLSVMDKLTVCLYESDIVTQEETPDSVRQFVKQRTRSARTAFNRRPIFDKATGANPGLPAVTTSRQDAE